LITIGNKNRQKLQQSEETADIPIIIITGVSSDLKRFIERAKNIKLPAAFLEKSVDKDNLLNTVINLID